MEERATDTQRASEHGGEIQSEIERESERVRIDYPLDYVSVGNVGGDCATGIHESNQQESTHTKIEQGPEGGRAGASAKRETED